MLSDEQRTTAIDAAAAAALAEIDDATPDANDRDMLWRLLVGGALCALMSEADDDTAASVAQRFNDRMERDGIGWRLVQSEPPEC